MKLKNFNWRKWADEWVLAGKGILLATKEKKFWQGFLPAFIIFGMLINLLSGGFSKFELMGALGMPRAMKIVGDAFVGVFGINMIFSEWMFLFLLAVMQGVLIGLIVLLWGKKREQNAANMQKAGIITGLIALGAGCPTCGTTLLTPLVGTIFSSGGVALAGALSGVMTAAAIIIAVLSLKRIGLETYVIIINEKYMEKHGKR